jgi:hypothetical protein
VAALATWLVPSAAVASAGADALLGPGALVFPAVVVLLVVLTLLNALTQGRTAIRMLGMLAGAWAILQGAGELVSGMGGSFSGYLIAWVVAGAVCVVVAGRGFAQDRSPYTEMDEGPQRLDD